MFQVSEQAGKKYVYCGFYGTRLEGETKEYQLFFEFYSYETNADFYGYTGFKIEFAEKNSKFLVSALI